MRDIALLTVILIRFFFFVQVIKDKRFFETSKSKFTVNLPELKSLPKNIVKNHHLSELLSKVERQQEDFI